MLSYYPMREAIAPLREENNLAKPDLFPLAKHPSQPLKRVSPLCDLCDLCVRHFSIPRASLGRPFSRSLIAAFTILAILTISNLISTACASDLAPKQDHGFRYTNDVQPELPMSIHIIQVERNRPDFEFCTTLGKGNAIGMGVVSEQIKALPHDRGQPLGGINGDFYDKKEKEGGRPRDIQIRFGELITNPAGHTAFWIAPDGSPQMTNIASRCRVAWPNGAETPIILNAQRDDDAAVLYTAVSGPSTKTAGGTELILEPGPNSSWLPLKPGERYAARVREIRTTGNSPLTADTMVLSLGANIAPAPPALRPGDIVQVITETSPDLRGVNVALGGGPALVRDGKPMQFGGLLKLRHPRAALGWNKDHFFLVEVDGRQRDTSIGMTFPEFADYLVKIGCTEAMNLDGGGSSTLWAFGRVQNSPSEGEERPAPNALVILKKSAAK